MKKIILGIVVIWLLYGAVDAYQGAVSWQDFIYGLGAAILKPLRGLLGWVGQLMNRVNIGI